MFKRTHHRPKETPKECQHCFREPPMVLIWIGVHGPYCGECYDRLKAAEVREAAEKALALSCREIA